MKSKETIKLLKEMLEKIKLAEPEEIIIDEKCNYDEIVHQLKE